MAEITNEQIHKSYEIGKKFYEGEISLREAKEILIRAGMKESSATDYIYAYSNLIQGKRFTRNMNAYSTDFYLKKIYNDDGILMLKNALLSLSQHLDYSEDKSGSRPKKRWAIYDYYSELVRAKNFDVIYPDDLESDNQYPEGTVKKIIVNTYERNREAREICLNYFGLSCKVCSFNFENVCGDLGKGFMHVHHVVDISLVGKEYSINPIEDLIPVCPNCHAMLHKRRPAYSVSELKELMK